MREGFSQETLQRIRSALDKVECQNPNFSMTITENRLISSFGYGEGITVYYTDGKYFGYISRERACDNEEYENEELAADRFIFSSSVGKRFH